MKKHVLIWMLAGALAFIAAPAAAKEGVYLGGGLVYNSIAGDDVDVYDPAFGLGLHVGYNFGSIAIEGNMVKSNHEADPGFADADFSGVSADLKVFFSQVYDPNQVYFLIGFGAYELDVDNGNLIEGNGFNFGLGMEHYFNDQVALNFGAVYRFIEYDEVNGIGVPEGDGDTLTLEVGINFHF